MSAHLIDVDAESFARSMGVGSLNDLLRELHMGTHARAVTAHFRQDAHAARMEDARVTALGEPEMVIDAHAFHYWGQREGYDCWNDDTFCREMKRDNPATRVKARTGRVMILNQWGSPAREEAHG